MRRNGLLFPSVFILCLSSVLSVGQAQQRNAVDDLIEGIINDVIDGTIDAAREEVRRNTGIDPLERGYDPDRRYEPVYGDHSDETRRELEQLNAEHDRKIAKLEEELRHKLAKAEAEFEREAAREDKPEKVEEKRARLQQQVDAAYAKFEEKIAEENARFDEKREHILSVERGGSGRDDDEAWDIRDSEYGDDRDERDDDYDDDRERGERRGRDN